MPSFRSLFRRAPAAAPAPPTVPSTDKVEMVDEEVQRGLHEAIEASTSRALEHRSSSYLGVLRTQIASLQELSAQFPDGMPLRLIGADLETFATELARACTLSAEACIRSADQDGSNALAVFERAFLNADYFTYEVHKQLIRGCDDIYHDGRAMMWLAFPHASGKAALDAPWWLARGRLLDSAYDTLRAAALESASAQRRAMADVVVAQARVENDAWFEVQQFWRTFSPVYIEQLAEGLADTNSRTSPGLRDVVTPDFVRQVLPDHAETLPRAAGEDIAFAFVCIQAHALQAEEECLAKASERLHGVTSIYGIDAELDEKLDEMVKMRVANEWSEVERRALGAARDRAREIGADSDGAH